MLPAARVGDLHVCPMWSGVVPHVGGPVIPPCAPTVLVGFMPAARLGDMCVCAGGPDTIVSGSATVLISGSLAARMSDLTVHGGMITIGCPTVLIGGPAPPAPPPPPSPPADMTPDEIAFMQAGNSPEDLEKRRAEQD